MARLCDELELNRNGGLEVRLVKRAVLIDRAREAGFERALLPGGDGRARTNRRRALLDEIGEGFEAFDWEYRYVYVNAVTLRRLGRTLDELLGRTPWEVIPALEGSVLVQAFREAMELGRSAVIEHRSVVDGQWLEARIYPTTMGVSCYYRGIDERKATEESLERSRRHAELLAWTASSLLSTDDPWGLVEELCRRVMVELGCEAFFNYVLDGANGRLRLNAWAGVGEEEARRIEWLDSGEAICGCAARDGCRIVSQDIPATPDPRSALIASYGVTAYACHPLMVQDEVLGTLSFGTKTRTGFDEDDLTLMKVVADHVAMAVHHWRAENERRRYELLATDTRDILLFMDREGRILQANAAAEQAYGYSQAELRELTIADLRAPDTHDAMAAQMAKADEHGILFETTHRRKDGSVFAVEVSARGATIGGRRALLSVVRDISERKRLELAREEVNASLAAANRIIEAALICETEEELGRACLVVAEQATGSKFGFIGEIGPDGLLHDIAISDPGWSQCTMEDQTGHRRPPGNFQLHGLYGRVLLDGESLLSNEPALHPDSSGTPEGHPALTAFLGVPLKRGDRTIGLIALGNREGGYTQGQRELVERLTPAIVQAFERKRAEEVLRQAARFAEALNTIGIAIGAATDVDAIAQIVVGAGRDAIGCEGAVAILAEGDTFVIQAALGLAEPLRGLRFERRASPIGVTDLPQEPFVSNDAAHDPRLVSGFAARFELKTLLFVPFIARADVLGVLAFGNLMQATPFTDDQVRFAGALATLAALAIENTRDYEVQHNIAVTLQENFVHPLPEVTGWEFAVASESASAAALVGGDFHDVFDVPPSNFAVLIGDVEGKGVAAAGLTETVRSATRALALSASSPRFVLERLNGLLLHDDPQLVTALFVHLSRGSGMYQLASAGHPRPLQLHTDGSVGAVSLAPAPPLGAFAQCDYQATTGHLGPGEALVLYTDGVIDARRGGRFFAEEGAIEALRDCATLTAQEIANRVLSAVSEYADELRDDVHILVIRRDPPDSSDTRDDATYRLTG